MSLLDSIKTTSMRPPRMLIYGTEGIGKTTIAAHAPAPIFIQTEDGEGAMELEAFPRARSFDDVLAAIAALYTEDHEYQTLVLDSVDHTEPLIWDKCCEDHSWESIETPGYGRGYIEALRYWHQLLEGLDALRDERNMMVLILGHASVARYDNPHTDSYDRYQLAIHKRASALVLESMDAVLFASHEVTVKHEDLGFNKTKTRGISTGQRVLHTEESAAWRAKNRYGMPAIVSLPRANALDQSWAVIQAAMSPGNQA